VLGLGAGVVLWLGLGVGETPGVDPESVSVPDDDPEGLVVGILEVAGVEEVTPEVGVTTEVGVTSGKDEVVGDTLGVS